MEDNDSVIKVYDMWKENPNLLFNPKKLKHSYAKQSFNRNFQDIGLRQVDDHTIQMSLQMPKSYYKSLNEEMKRPKVEPKEATHRIPDPLKLELPPGSLGGD
mmetsp:Transcript_21990/g.34140  ORF Transcript_21990/g.34140 Transcript_21990/m.34140 type:complete len:102 (+) Transcript_21990:147-452(+)